MAKPTFGKSNQICLFVSTANHKQLGCTLLAFDGQQQMSSNNNGRKCADATANIQPTSQIGQKPALHSHIAFAATGFAFALALALTLALSHRVAGTKKRKQMPLFPFTAHCAHCWQLLLSLTTTDPERSRKHFRVLFVLFLPSKVSTRVKFCPKALLPNFSPRQVCWSDWPQQQPPPLPSA